LLHSTAKAPEDHLRLLVETIGSRLVEGWGMTENSGGLVAATSAQDYEDRRPRIFSSTGRAGPETVVRLIDNDGEELPQDGQTVGQLIFHSGSLARGYWNDSAATDAAFRDGWYRSGDLGMIDPDGYIYVLDRRADLIISGGMNIYPSELEHVIMQFPGVTECAVIGITHDRWGQRPIAFVVRSDETVTTEAITRFCRERLAGYKQPDEIRFLSTLPKNAGGKVLRKALRDSIDYS
jgi:fatty-acyl-CoA synthase